MPTGKKFHKYGSLYSKPGSAHAYFSAAPGMDSDDWLHKLLDRERGREVDHQGSGPRRAEQGEVAALQCRFLFPVAPETERAGSVAGCSARVLAGPRRMSGGYELPAALPHLTSADAAELERLLRAVFKDDAGAANKWLSGRSDSSAARRLSCSSATSSASCGRSATSGTPRRPAAAHRQPANQRPKGFEPNGTVPLPCPTTAATPAL
jgi:hypothetical protein